MKLIILFFCLFYLGILTVSLYSNNESKNIRKRINKITDLEEKVNTLNNLADSLFTISKEQSLKLFDEALQLAKKINYNNGICENHYIKAFYFLDNNEFLNARREFLECMKYIDQTDYKKIQSCLEALGYINYSLGNYKGAISSYTKLKNNYIESGETDKKISKIYTKIGNVYLEHAKYYSAQEMYLRALESAKNANDKWLLSDCYVNIGIVKNYLCDFKGAERYSFKALKINYEINNKQKIANNLANIGKIYLNELKFDSSLVYLFKSLDILKNMNEKKVEANVLSVISQIYFHKKQYDKSLKYALDARKTNSEINNITGYYWDLYNISRIFLKTKTNIDEAKSFLDSIYYYSYISDLQSLLNYTYIGYCEYFYIKRNVDSLYYYFTENTDLQDKIYQSDIKSEISNLEDKFRLEKELSEEKINQIEKNRKQWLIIISLITGAFALFLIAFVIWWERRKSEKLLLNVLPKSIASRLKTKKKSIADNFESASIVFIDIAHFTFLSKDAKPERVVEVLNNIYTIFDHIAEKYGLEKIKTIGDCYMAAAGVPLKRDDHAEIAANFALEAMKKMEGYDTGDGTILHFRCGIDCGPIVAGVIGEKKFIYDLWGDTVNTASRMEQYGEAGKIHVTKRFKNKLEIKANSRRQTADRNLVISQQSTVDRNFKFEERGEIEIKGKGMMKTYFLMNNE
ncbi:MAG: adenylate/guanylate cyclase domain-containing protein [bacterium]